MDKPGGEALGLKRRREAKGHGGDRDPGRQFGYEMAFDRRFEGRRWNDVEPELRAEYRAWTGAHGYPDGEDGKWEDVKGRVQEAWESALDVERTQVDPRTGRWEERALEYRRLWEERYGVPAVRWEDVEPGYRYADEMAFDPRYQGRPWGEVAPFLESGLPAWATVHGYQVREGESLWERLRQSIRHAWHIALRDSRRA